MLVDAQRCFTVSNSTRTPCHVCRFWVCLGNVGHRRLLLCQVYQMMKSSLTAGQAMEKGPMTAEKQDTFSNDA